MTMQPLDEIQVNDLPRSFPSCGLCMNWNAFNLEKQRLDSHNICFQINERLPTERGVRLTLFHFRE